jgi:UDP-N-acetylglucosamine 2-epimerase (non-hydrolysing)
MKFMSVVGARPNFMKIASIISAINEYNNLIQNSKLKIQHLLVHTGQHYDESMSSVFFKELGIPQPHFNLGVGSSSHSLQTAQIMERFEPILLQKRPHVLLLVGDVNSTIACALVASKIEYRTKTSKLNPRNLKQRPLISHVEAGLRSFDQKMPEEINRVLTDALSDLLFVTEEDAILNLKKEGISIKKIHFVGNVMIDTLITNLSKIRRSDTLESYKRLLGENENGYGVVTLHRPSNVDSRQDLSELMNCLQIISGRIPLIFPIHPRTKRNLDRFGIDRTLSKNRNILFIEPLSYLAFLTLVKSAKLVMTDSGGIQEETTYLKIPCITLRDNTERPVTVTMGTNYLVGTNRDKIVETAFLILNGKGKKGKAPPLWDGKAGQRIVKILVNQLVTSNK